MSDRPRGKISLVLADVDGTLVTKDKVLTERAVEAVAALRRAGIAFAVTSGRPPRGMAMLIEPLGITTVIAGFNGGAMVKPDLSVIEEKVLAPDVARKAIAIMRDHGLAAPRDYSLVGYNDIPPAAHFTPALTTINQKTDVAGALLVEKLMQQLDGGQARSTVLPTDIVVRET